MPKNITEQITTILQLQTSVFSCEKVSKNSNSTRLSPASAIIDPISSPVLRNAKQSDSPLVQMAVQRARRVAHFVNNLTTHPISSLFPSKVSCLMDHVMLPGDESKFETLNKRNGSRLWCFYRQKCVEPNLLNVKLSRKSKFFACMHVFINVFSTVCFRCKRAVRRPTSGFNNNYWNCHDV